jgi:hypothetical protein
VVLDRIEATGDPTHDDAVLTDIGELAHVTVGEVREVAEVG